MLAPFILLGILVLAFQLVWLRENRSKFISPTTIAMFKQILRQQTLSINCDVCRGLGYITSPNDDNVSFECPVCFGSKRHEIRIFDDYEKICPTCLGMGRVVVDPNTGTGGVCPTCEGRGVVRMEVPERQPLRGYPIKIECPKCNGIGTVKDEDEDGQTVRSLCPLCLGVGHHTIYRYKKTHATCAACGGMGRLQDPETGEYRFCKRCGGSGLVEIIAADTNRVEATETSSD